MDKIASTKDPDIVVRDRIFVKKSSKLFTETEVRSRYIIDMFNESVCAKCDNREFRPNEICQECAAYDGKYKFFSEEKIGKSSYYGLPLADIRHVKIHTKGKKFKAVNKAVKPPMRSKLKFTGKLFGKGARDKDGNPRADQVRLVEEWLREKNGIIQANPRTGKTVIATYIACELGVRTIVIAHQKEFLAQFYQTFVGKASKDVSKRREPMTNARKIMRRTGKPVVKIATSIQDVKNKNIDVLLINPQKFYRQLDKMTALMKGKFGLLIVDEVHSASADIYSKVVAKVDATYRLGLSATPGRKDGRDKLTDFTIGPITTVSDTVTIKPTIRVYVPKSRPRYEYRSWNGIWQWYADDTGRNKEIIQAAFRDLRNGHTTVILPVKYRRHIHLLVKTINAVASKLRKQKKEDWPLDLAVPFDAQSDRRYALGRADDDSPCILVAIESMIKQGIDLKTPSSIHMLIPMSATAAVGSPMFKQMSFRVCTPCPGKDNATMTLWVDDISLSKRCLLGLYWNEINPGVKSGSYLIDSSAKTLLSSMRADKPIESSGVPVKESATLWSQARSKR